MSSILDAVRAHLRGHFAALGVDDEPAVAKVTFLGVEPLEVLRFGPDRDGVLHYASLGCARHPMGDPLAGPRAEVVLSLRLGPATPGIARSVALVAATPAVEDLVLQPDALIDLGAPLWQPQPGHAAPSAVLLDASAIADLEVGATDPVRFFTATPITANEAAWVRLKGAGELRDTWAQDGTDVLDPGRI